MGRRAHDLPDLNWRLWTRGGTSDVSLINTETEVEIEIPSELLRSLVAYDIQGELISRFEQMDDDEILGMLGRIK